MQCTLTVLLEIYDVIDFDVLPVAATAVIEVKHSQFKMAASMAFNDNNEILTLIDEENKSYSIQVSVEDTERARNDLQFATLLLKQAKLISSNTDNIDHVNLNLEDISISEDTNTTSTDDSKFNEKNENNNDKDQHNWTKEETLLLLDIYITKEKEFHSGKCTIKHCWENVSKEMKKMGYDINGKKCSIKFQALKRTYKAIKDHNNRSGNDTKKWEYFDVFFIMIMDKIFSTKPWVQSLSIAGTSVDITTSSGEENEQQSTISKRKSNIEKYMEKVVAEKKLKRESSEKRHQEKMEQLQKIQALLEKVIQK